MALAVVLTLLAGIPPPPYRYEEELDTRAAIQRFMREDQAISARWHTLMEDRQGLSFDQVAQALHSDVAASYEHSFNELAAVQAGPGVPSRPTLLQLQTYAVARQEAALQAAQELRSRGAGHIVAPKASVPKSPDKP